LAGLGLAAVPAQLPGGCPLSSRGPLTSFLCCTVPRVFPAGPSTPFTRPCSHTCPVSHPQRPPPRPLTPGLTAAPLPTMFSHLRHLTLRWPPQQRSSRPLSRPLTLSALMFTALYPSPLSPLPGSRPRAPQAAHLPPPARLTRRHRDCGRLPHPLHPRPQGCLQGGVGWA